MIIYIIFSYLFMIGFVAHNINMKLDKWYPFIYLISPISFPLLFGLAIGIYLKDKN